MFETAQPLRDEFAALEAALADPEIHADLARARKVGRRYAELTPIVTGMDEYERTGRRSGGGPRAGRVDDELRRSRPRSSTDRLAGSPSG